MLVFTNSSIRTAVTDLNTNAWISVLFEVLSTTESSRGKFMVPLAIFSGNTSIRAGFFSEFDYKFVIRPSDGLTR